MRLLREGGRLSYIVTNKWLRAGYGEPLRAFFANEGALEQIVDFGHAPIFADADVFPCILVVEKPASTPQPPPPSPTRGEGEFDRWEISDVLRVRMVEVARGFRKEATASEAILWQALRGKQLDGRKFRRQQPIGPFVVDFYCAAERVIVEVDGPIHEDQRVADQERQRLLETLGLRFVRVAAADVETSLQTVLSTLRRAFRTPSPLVGEGAGGEGPEPTVQVTSFPREALGLVQLDGYIRRYGHAVPRSRFGKAPWSLETSEIDDLMAKIRQRGVPLAESAGRPFRGILTGLTEAFVIDNTTKDQLVKADPRSAEMIKPYLRGQDMSRWEADWRNLWFIGLKSSGDHTWPWSNDPDGAEAIFQQTYPALYQHLKPFEGKLRQRQDKGRYWWELRSCAYYDRFDQPKILYPDITWRSQFSLDTDGHFSNNTVYFLPTDSAWLLAVLNSPLLWSFCWREAVHGKDEALRFFSDFVERIPVAQPTDIMRAEVEPAVARLVAIAQANQEARRDTLDWLRTEFGVEAPGQKLEAFAQLDEVAFVDEVRKRRPKSAGVLSVSGLKALRHGYNEQATPMRERQGEAMKLERRLATLVNEAYGLTTEDVETLWRTAPPRMPVGRGE